MKLKQDAKKFTAKDGLDIYYWVNWQKGLTKEFKVLHHGASQNHSALERIERGLNERGHPTIVFDARGVGYSQGPLRPEFYTLDRLSGDLQGIIEKEGIEDPSLVSHSMGFMPVIDYAARTKNVRNITGICSSYDLSKTAPHPFLFHLWNSFLWTEYVNSALSYMGHVLKGEQREYPDLSKLLGASEVSVLRKILDIPFAEISVHFVNGSIGKMDITPQLRGITAPMHLIYGKKDVMVRPWAGEYISQQVKGPCTIDIINGSHAVPITYPERVLDAIDSRGF